MVTERFSEGTQIKIKMTKDATGTDFMARIRGAKSSCIFGSLDAMLPPNTPASTARKKPPIIRKSEKQIVFQKEASKIKLPSLFRTATGDTRSISCPSHILTISHTNSQKSTAHNFIFLFFLLDVIEVMIWYFSSYCLRVLCF